jgi:hypothetical protein
MINLPTFRVLHDLCSQGVLRIGRCLPRSSATDLLQPVSLAETGQNLHVAIVQLASLSTVLGDAYLNPSLNLLTAK